MLLRIVGILTPLFAIAALGFFVGRRLQPDLSSANRLNMDVFVPALVFGALASKDFRLTEYLPLAGITLVMVIGSGLAGAAVARMMKIDPRTLVPPVMFNNCGNLGLPLAVLAFGPDALAPMIVMFMISNFLHFSFGAWYLDHHTRLTTLWRVPSVLATVAGIAVGALGWHLWEPLMIAIRMVGDIAIPLMLFSLGARIGNSRFGAVGMGVLGALVRPAVGLALAAAVLAVVPLPPQQAALVWVFGSLPPAVLNYIFAERYRQEPEKVASIVLIGNIACVGVLPFVLAYTLP